MFQKVDTRVDFPALERETLSFWERTRAFDRLREKNRGKPGWSFLDGPITANNPMGVHHAWGRTYKDVFQRFFAMTGRELRYQNGFDCQGLWVEVEVEKELKLQTKRDIENLVPGDRDASLARFVQLCKERVDRFAKVQTAQSIRLGYWMDWDREEDWQKPPDQRRSYFTMSEENNYSIWAFLKKCHQRGLIYRGFDAMPWCPRCGVGLSEMEVKEGYKVVTHKSVYARFMLRDRPGEYLLVWTTTPWTLPSNVAAAVNPDLTYLRIRQKGDVYYVGKVAFTGARDEGQRPPDLDEVDVEASSPTTGKKAAPPRAKTIESLFKERAKEGYEVLGEVSGAELVGLAYDGPFDELPAQQQRGGFPAEIAGHVNPAGGPASSVTARDAHRVIAWKDVGATTGTGIVHIAPGCGKEDFELGREQGLPPVAPLDEAGTFIAGFGWLSGRAAGDPELAEAVIGDLKRKERLFAAEPYAHSYPHCWRCKTALLFRLVDEWFIRMGPKPGPGEAPQGYRAEIMRVTEQVRFLPESINGRAREMKWLEQMGDWMISKKRFWGLALPIWVDEKTGDFEVIGSREELRARAVEGWDEFAGHTPHRPWIDQIKIRNDRTGNLMSRIPDVGNPWLDAGIVPYSTMGYNTDRAAWERWFPAEFITESFPGQFRNWFYAILAMSTMMENRAPFRILLGHALVLDERGETMSKSKGNAIEFNEAADRMGADVMRWLYCRSNPAMNIKFGYGIADEVRSKVHLKLWNTYAFFVNYARLDRFDPSSPPVPVQARPALDRWILSDLQKLVGAARRELESFNLMGFCLEAERFVDSKLSNWYVRRNRRRFWKSEASEDKQAAYQTLYTVLVTLAKLFAPMLPFLTERMYQNLVAGAGAGSAEASVHHCAYPEPDQALVDEELSADMEALLELISLGGSARNGVKIKMRQPLAEMKFQAAGPRERRVVERFRDQVLDELNVKAVTLHDPAASGAPLLRPEVGPNMKSLAPRMGPRLKQAQQALASADPLAVAAAVQGGGAWPLDLGDGEVVRLTAEDLTIRWKAPEGWAGGAGGSGQVAFDTRLTPELAAEGMAREVVRHVQELRKTAGLELEDRIELGLYTGEVAIRAALDAHRDYIAGETQAVRWGERARGDRLQETTVRLDDGELTIQIHKADRAG